MKRLFSAALVIALSIIIPAASAVVIDFENVIPPGDNRFGDPIFTYNEDGFVLSDFDSGNSNALFGPSGPQNDNGTDILGWISNSSFDITKSGGGLFSLSSFDATNLDRSGNAGNFLVTGFLGGGGTITANLSNVLNTYTTYNFGAAWTGLSKVQIGNFGMLNGAIDNIVVDAGVPAPSGILLLIVGVMGLGAANRRRVS